MSYEGKILTKDQLWDFIVEDMLTDEQVEEIVNSMNKLARINEIVNSKETLVWQTSEIRKIVKDTPLPNIKSVSKEKED